MTTRCDCKTLKGKRCSRKGIYDGFCYQHKKCERPNIKVQKSPLKNRITELIIKSNKHRTHYEDDVLVKNIKKSLKGTDSTLSSFSFGQHIGKSGKTEMGDNAAFFFVDSEPKAIEIIKRLIPVYTSRFNKKNAVVYENAPWILYYQMD